ncbi:peptidoglycan-binding protein [Streptomyces sp. NPDC013953]|uniref:peptidoglycan-binding protein n=1 Tax=Streptomyces sp. NPDC013953 TaxID=3364868 RepID=UPI003702AE43
MPDLWLPGTERHPLGDTAPTHTQHAPKAIWLTWDRNATAAKPADLVPFGNLVRYFTGAGRASAPHLLWDPLTGRIAQFYPATSRSKSVVDTPGGTRTHLAVKIVLQVETLFFPHCRVNGRTCATVRDTPPRDWTRSPPGPVDGVPDDWPMGKPTWTGNRSGKVWASRGGHYGLGQAPENTHNDPGPMPDWPTSTKPGTPPPFLSRSAFGPGKANDSVLLLGSQLVQWCRARETAAMPDAEEPEVKKPHLVGAAEFAAVYDVNRLQVS